MRLSSDYLMGEGKLLSLRLRPVTVGRRQTLAEAGRLYKSNNCRGFQLKLLTISIKHKTHGGALTMKQILLSLLVAVLMVPIGAFAAVDTVDVASDPFTSTTGGNLNNAIQTAINSNTLSNTVFKLQADGYYLLSGQITTPVGSQLTIVGPNPGKTQATALPQIVPNNNGTNWTVIMDIYGNITMKNVWMMYSNNQGLQTDGAIVIEDDSVADASGAGEVGNFDDVVFDYDPNGDGSGGSVTLQCKDFKGTFTNCFFRNDVSPTFQWYGRAVSWTYNSTAWHTDSVSFVNCTFNNMGYGLMQESPEYADNVWFNHCTFLNIMLFPMESGYWHNIAIANCLFENTFMVGSTVAGYAHGAPNGGTLNIDTLSSEGFTVPYDSLQRHIFFTHSAYYEQSWLTNYMAHSPFADTVSNPLDKVSPQPMVSKKTMGFSDNPDFPYIHISDLIDGVDPHMIAPTTNIDSAEAFLEGVWAGGATVNWAFEPDSDTQGHWPMPGNLAYTNDTLLTAGMAGFPLGDLYHWFPSQYTAWKAQQASEDQAINDSMNTATAITGPVATVPYKYALSQNYPNPFNPTTEINYSLAKKGFVSIKVYNVLGEQVANLVSGVQAPGNHEISFNGAKFASGVYFYRLTAGNVVITKKMIMLK